MNERKRCKCDRCQLHDALLSTDIQDRFNVPVSAFKFEGAIGTRALNCCCNAGVTHAGHAAKMTRAEWRKVKNAGKGVVDFIEKNLRRLKLSFGMEIGDWQAPLEGEGEGDGDV